MSSLEDAMHVLQADMNVNADKAFSILSSQSTEAKFLEACALLNKIKTDLSVKNCVWLQMMFDEKLSYVMGYLSAATNSEAYRKLWVKMRLKSVGFEVPEYAEFDNAGL